MSSLQILAELAASVATETDDELLVLQTARALEDCLGGPEYRAFRFGLDGRAVRLFGEGEPSEELLIQHERAKALKRSIVIDGPCGAQMCTIWDGCSPPLGAEGLVCQSDDDRAVLRCIEAMMVLWRSRQVGKLRVDFAAEVAEELSRSPHEPLVEQLERLARIACRLQGIEGALVMAVDKEGEPLAFGAEGLDLNLKDPYIKSTLSTFAHQLRRHKGEPPWPFTWSTFGHVIQPDELQAYPIKTHKELVGYILVEVSPELTFVKGDWPLKTLVELLHLPIRNAKHWGAVELIEGFLDFAVELDPLNRRDLDLLMKRLQNVFKATAVSLFLLDKDKEQLRLSATSDLRLNQSNKDIFYAKGEGLTGWLYEHRKPLRLNDTSNPSYIRSRLGIDRSLPKFSERNLDGQMTIQFLGVPLLRGDEFIGVLRMSRIQGVHAFTEEEEFALRLFSNLLAARLAGRLETLINRRIRRVASESFILSRYEPGANQEHSDIIVEANDGALDMLGRTKKDLLGTNAIDLYAEGYGRVRMLLRKSIEDDQRTTDPIEVKLHGRGGRAIPVSISFRLLKDEMFKPPVQYTLGIARDISRGHEFKELQKRIWKLLGDMEVVYFNVDKAGFLRNSSELESRLTGYSREELFKNPRSSLYAKPSDRKRVLKKAREVFPDLAKVAVKIKKKNGESFVAVGVVRVIKDKEGNETGLEGCYRDASDRIQILSVLGVDIGSITSGEDPDAILSDVELLIRLNRDAEIQVDYLTSLGHQLLSPLGALLRNFKAQNNEDLLPLIGQTRDCISLVRNLSFLDRILQGKPFEKENLSLRKLLIDVIKDSQHRADEAAIGIELHPGTYPDIYGHRMLLFQVFFNLLDNALKYSREKSSIHIRLIRAGNQPMIEIVNTGFPILKKEQETLFERGFRGYWAALHTPAGTGFGLWLVRKILNVHNAHISYQTRIEDNQNWHVFQVQFSLRIR